MKKFSENYIRYFAQELGWRDKEMRIALKRLFENESIVKDWESYFIICCSAKNPKERQHKITEYLIENLDGDLVKTISNQLYNPDPCFGVQAVFNARDIGSEIKKTVVGYYPKDRKSFLISGVLLGDDPFTMEVGEVADPRLSAHELCYDFLNSLILTKNKTHEDKIESLLFGVIQQAYFLTLNIKAFRNLVVHWSRAPYMKKKAIKLAAALNDSYESHHKEITEIQYWTYYVLVETLKNRYGVRGAFREVGRRLDEPATSIQRRYVDMKKRAGDLGLSAKDITKKYQLGKALEDMMTE